MRRAARIMVFAAALSAACARYPSSPGERITAPDPRRAGVAGADGPRGAAIISFAAQSRVTESLAIEVVFPARADNTLLVERTPYPAVVFLQGAAITRERYHWLAAHLATRGYVVILPDHPFNLPMLDTDHAILALRAVRDAAVEPGTLQGAVDPAAPAAVVGHSLGGVIAARQWVQHAEFLGLVMLAAYPAGTDDVASRPGSPVLLVAGTADVPTPLTRVQESLLSFRPPRLYAQVDGLNHYAWTDSPASDELTSDGPRPPDLAATRRQALTVVDRWLDATLRRDADAAAALDRGGFPGVTLLR